MQSQQNLKHSNLLEVPLKGRNKIFQGRAVPVQAGEDKGMLKRWILRVTSGVLCRPCSLREPFMLH